MSRHAPVGHTCPDIDNCIKWLKLAADYIESAKVAADNIDDIADSEDVGAIKDLVYGLIDNLKEALNYIDISGELEELRNANSVLRDWGYELASEIETLESVHYNNQTQS